MKLGGARAPGAPPVPTPMFMLAEVSNDRLIVDCISGCRKAINIGQKFA